MPERAGLLPASSRPSAPPGPALAPGGHDLECPACGREASRSDVPYSHRLVRCAACGLLWQIAPPTGDELSRLYQSGFYGGDEPRGRLPVRILHGVNNAIRLRELRGLPAGRLLDVGCGKGRFLSAAESHGWQAVGVELAGGMASQARERGLDIREGDFLTMDLDGSFDVVTMWHVLEHLPEPGRAVARARDILRPAGRLVVSVPNIESAQARLGGRNWFHLDLPRHIFHFSPRALTSLLERHGFKVERVGHFYPEMEAVGFVQTISNAAGVERDLLYRFLKRDPKVEPSPSLVLAALIGLAGLPGAAAWTAAAASLRLGASIQVVATAR